MKEKMPIVDRQPLIKKQKMSTLSELQKIAQNTPIKATSFDKGENLNVVYLREGSKGVQRIIEQDNGIEPVTPIEEVPVPFPPITPEKEETTTFLDESEEEKFLNVTFEEAHIDLENKYFHLKELMPGKQLMRTPLLNYYVLGEITQDMSSLPITLMVESKQFAKKDRVKIDLYEKQQLTAYCENIGFIMDIDAHQVQNDLLKLTDLIEVFREEQLLKVQNMVSKPKRTKSLISQNERTACLEFLSQPDLFGRINELIGKTGVVGEESTRMLLFVIASTYKMQSPIHSLVQGTSGSGKSHLINSIGKCFPNEDVISMTRVTSKSFYHYTKDELVDKLILIQDFDGLDEEAQYAFRELQSSGNISSSTTYKDRYGNLMSAVKTVRSHFASLLATTKAEIYYDNLSRSLVAGVDESSEQTTKIIHYQNKKLAGYIDAEKELKARTFLQNCMRTIRKEKVINPYADKVFLPFEAKMLRRLNSHYQSFVQQVTLLHQYQRTKDEYGRLIAEPEDLKMACDILFDAIMLKVDELDSSLRQFFDRMKVFIQAQAKESAGKPSEHQFTQRDVRLSLNTSKTQCFRYFEQLEQLEYIQRAGGYANRGFKYRIVFWDDMEKIRSKVKTELERQLENIQSKNEINKYASGS